MSETILPETKIGEALSMGVEMEEDEIGLFIASADVSASCGFRPDEWEKFVEAVSKSAFMVLVSLKERWFSCHQQTYRISGPGWS